MKPTPIPLTGDGAPWVSVEVVDGARGLDWDQCVQQFPEAGPFHGSVWMRVLESTYGFRSMSLVLRRENRIVGLVPMVKVDSRFTGRRGVALPFADECPPLVTADVPVGSLLGPVARFAESRKWDFLEIRGQHPAFGAIITEFPQSGKGRSADGSPGQIASVSFHGHRLCLPGNREELWHGLKGPIRTAVRKAEAAGVRVEKQNSVEALREFYRLYRLTRQRHGLPPQPFSFFEAIHHEILSGGAAGGPFQLGGELILARHQGRAVAGAVFFRRGDRAIYKYGAFNHRFQELRANNLLFWNALRRFVEEGVRWVDLGRTSVGNEGLRRFKLGWGAEEYAIRYTKYDLHQRAFVKEKDLAAGWYNWAFRTAPRWLSAAAGRILYKHWA